MTTSLQSETHLIRAYTGLTRVIAPVLPLWIKRRALKGKEDPDRRSERFGKSSVPRPAGTLIWMHGASVGECLMMQPLIKRILSVYRDATVLITSGTVTSAKLMETVLPLRCIHQYVPLDTPRAVESFLSHWQPNAAIWAESEIWPNLIQHTHAMGIPMALINARMSQDSLAQWGKRKKSAKALLGCFDLILAADENTANGIGWLLDKDVGFTGNLKGASAPLPADPDELSKLKRQINGRPVWCAASTHPGEDALILAAHRTVLDTHKDAVLILAPRHPERRAEIAAMTENAGFKYACRSEGDNITKTKAVYIFDTMGELGLAYRLSSLTFVCGSLLRGLSGHNPLEPARLGNAILTGTHISSFADTYMSMFSFQAAERVFDAAGVGPRVVELISDPTRQANIAKLAADFAASRDSVLDTVWAEILPLLRTIKNAPA